MVWLLIGSGWHGQATLYLFQKHLLCWVYEYIVYHNGIAFVKVKFCVLLEFPFLKNLIASKKLQSPLSYETVFFEMDSKRLELRELCSCPDQPASSLPNSKGSSYHMKAVASCTRASLHIQTLTVTVYHKVHNLLINFWTQFQLIHL